MSLRLLTNYDKKS